MRKSKQTKAKKLQGQKNGAGAEACEPKLSEQPRPKNQIRKSRPRVEGNVKGRCE